MTKTDGREDAWAFVLRDENGALVGHGVVEAANRIEAVSRARMVRLSDVLRAIPPSITSQAGEDVTIAQLHNAGGVVLDWTTSNPEGA